jgi:hypothetical protein
VAGLTEKQLAKVRGRAFAIDRVEQFETLFITAKRVADSATGPAYELGQILKIQLFATLAQVDPDAFKEAFRRWLDLDEIAELEEQFGLPEAKGRDDA